MPHWIILGLNVSPALPAVLSAVYWWRSAKVEYPAELRGIVPHGGRAFVDTSPLVASAQETGRLNKIAAAFAAITAFLTAAAYVTTALIPPVHTL